MKIIDTHLHLLEKPDTKREMNLNKDELSSLSERVRKAGIEKGVAIILDTDFLNKDFPMSFDNLAIIPMLDFRKNEVLLKGDGIKFHPFHQKIKKEDYDKAMVLAKQASAKGMIIIVDAHNVPFKTDKYSELRFAKHLLSEIKTPLVLAHSGGLRALEAVVLALDYPNVYLETSFSVSFWKGSSIEQDLAYCFKKLGSDRCMYGSDAPYIDMKESIDVTLEFLKEHDFSKKDIENIMYNTAKKLYG